VITILVCIITIVFVSKNMYSRKKRILNADPSHLIKNTNVQDDERVIIANRN